VAQSGCYFNNAAIAVRAAQAAGAQRVLLVDWDVHHGAGTQAGGARATELLTPPMNCSIFTSFYDSENCGLVILATLDG
jgi:acetoin utilization deacetylase AcuC-like enzyme